jgi:hypothetical protein
MNHDIAILPENTLVLLRDFHLHLEDNTALGASAIRRTETT